MSIYSCNTAIIGGLPQIVAANILSNNSLNTKITDDVSSNCNQNMATYRDINVHTGQIVQNSTKYIVFGE